jgi:hypothetical protein
VLAALQRATSTNSISRTPRAVALQSTRCWCSGSVVNIFADVWAIRAPMNRDYSVSMYLQNFSDTLLANMRGTIEERATMCRQKGYKPAGCIPAIFAPSACEIPS